MATHLLLDDGVLMLWGIQLRKPDGWWVEVPDSTRDHRGEIRLKAPRGATLAVTWGRLEEARRRFPAPTGHMDACLRRIGGIIEGSRIVVFSRKSQEIHGHPIEVASVEILPRGGWLGRTHHALAAVIHCAPRDRFYSLYTHPFPSPDQAMELSFDRVLRDFRCH